MNVKIDTKDKFVEMTPQEANLTANMAEDISKLLLTQLNNNIPHVIFNAEKIETCDDVIITTLCNVKEQFINSNVSLVFCCLQPVIYKTLEEQELIDFFNITPTLSEAWDILQLEEIERELFNDFEE